MPPTLARILYLLTLRGWRGVAVLWSGMVAVALFEVAGVASVMPFIAVASRPQLIESQPLLHRLYQFTGAAGPMDFLVILGAAMIALLVSANAMAALVNWKLFSFTYRRGHEISQALLGEYMAKPYLYFLAHNTSLMSKMILSQVSQVVSGVLIPSLQLVARTLVLVFMLVLLMAVNPLVTLVIFGVAGSCYIVLFFMMRRHILRLGQQAIKAEAERHKAVAEALAGIKEVKLMGRGHFFLDRFSRPSAQAARYSGGKETMALMPRYLLESLAFSAMVGIVLFLLARQQSLNDTLPTLALYALIGARMMPALQQVFHNIAVIRYNVPALAQLCETLESQQADGGEETHVAPLPLERHIELQNLNFTYPGQDEPVVNDLSLLIPARQITALVGATGSGKSTLADLITGMLSPQSGAIRIDDTLLNAHTLRAWQDGIGYVPQHIFLLDESVRRNIAFGIEDKKIDEAAVIRAAEMAQIDGFIRAELKEGYDTVVGERGIRLSGGQRQRIGLARALYHNPQLLVLDEATSALDNVTERTVMEAIHSLGGSKTVIVIAHRLSTVQQCDHIVLLKHGKSEAEGTYESLLATSPAFQRLVHAISEEREGT